MAKRPVKFENHSASGIYRAYGSLRLDIPGQSIGEKAVILDVPEELIPKIRAFLAKSHPPVVMSEVAPDQKPNEPKTYAASVKNTLPLVDAALTGWELDKLADGEDRVTIIKAIDARRAELAGGK